MMRRFNSLTGSAFAIRRLIFLLVLLATTSAVAEVDGEEVASIREQMDSDGYVILRQFFDTSMLQEWKEFSEIYFYRAFQEMYNHGHIDAPKPIQVELSKDGKHLQSAYYTMRMGPEYGFKEIVHRYPGRYELSLQLPKDGDRRKGSMLEGMPNLDPIIEKVKPIALSIFQQHPLASKLTSSSNKNERDNVDFNLIYSFLMSTTGAAEQMWHVDGGHLESSNGGYYPTHCFNVFIPLVDVTEDLGPTEVVPKSHRKRHTAKVNQGMKPSTTPFSPTLTVGDAFLFDFRTLHRGLSNKSLTNRPILVLTFSIPSFSDTLNWPEQSLFDSA